MSPPMAGGPSARSSSRCAKLAALDSIRHPGRHTVQKLGADVVVVGTVRILFALVSRRLRGTVVSAAMVFVGAGLLLGGSGLGVVEASASGVDVRLLAEVTLALVLFSEASALNTRALQHETDVPLRLLAIGLPLTILLGTLVAIPIFPEIGIFELIVLAVLLAPTDAALGQAVVSDARLPSRLRQALSVESGLNDGVCVPLLFAAVASAELAEAPKFDGEILVNLVKELGIAAAVGAAVATSVVVVTRMSRGRHWLDERWVQVVPLATVAVAYSAAVGLGGSGFIAAFVAGLVYGRLYRGRAPHTILLMDEVGNVLTAVTFFLFGAVVVPQSVTDVDVASLLYAVLSLTLIRMVPVALALIRSGSPLPTVAFAGWFGPRGLASIVFMLTIVASADLPGTPTIVQVVSLTVLLSVLAHGATAKPLTERYVRWLVAAGKG